VHILITEFMDQRAVDRLSARHDVLHDPKLVDDTSRLLAEAGRADALIVRNRTQVRGDLLAALSRCRAVGRLGVGLDNIDVPGCEARNIRVIPATGANAESVAEYVICTAMLLLRGAYAHSSQVAAGRWPREALGGGREIGGRLLGLIGFGSIGRLTARLAQRVGMRVIAYDALLDASHPALAAAGVQWAGFDELLASADVVSLHVPLVDSTRGLLDARRIASMKHGAALINTARGGVVDEVALTDALRRGALGGAALDVFETEPLPPSPHFADCPNLILTPHVAGVTQDSNQRVSTLIADKVLEALG
jgi:(S)-sulfolactate dehydrogenase